MKLIKLQDKFILVSDEEASEKTLSKGETYFNMEDYTLRVMGTGNCWAINGKRKIIAGIPELPEIDFSLLSETDCLEVGFIDVEKLANEETIRNEYNSEISFKQGFRRAQSLKDKMFSEEDIVNIVNYYEKTAKLSFDSTGENHGMSVKDIVIKWQSLQQKSWDVEVEMEAVPHSQMDDFPTMNVFKPKITNGKIKLTKIL